MPPPIRLQSSLEAQVAAGAPGALARIEAPRVGLSWDASAGQLARGNSRALRPDDAFRAASVTKSVTAVVAVSLAQQRRLALDEPLGDQLDPELLQRWSALDAIPRTTPQQLLAHTSGVPNYFNDEAFLARLRQDPGHVWRPVELVDHAGVCCVQLELASVRSARSAGHMALASSVNAVARRSGGEASVASS